MNETLTASQDMIEEMSSGLYSKCEQKHKFPVAYVTLKINMSDMNEESRRKVYQAEQLLSEVGICFDTGSGCGCRDWELDWSLRGAFPDVHRLQCYNHNHNEKVYLKHAYWATYKRNDGYIQSLPYCSVACRDEAIEQRAESHKVIDLGESDAI